MDKYLSDKIRILSFVAILFVILLHAQLIEYSTGINLISHRFISGEITKIAVPLFFTISGFLLFYSCEKFSLSWYIKKIKSRVKTLVLPFFAWSLWGFFIVYLIKSFNPCFFSSAQPLAEYQVYDYLYTLLWHPVGTYQLWFIRDLMVCVILSPFIYYALKYLGFYFLVLLALLWSQSIQKIISIESLMFVSLGSYIALYKKKVVEYICTSSLRAVLYTIFFLCSCVLDMCLTMGYYIRCIVIISGMLSLWSIYDILYDNVFNKLKDAIIVRYTFFIYAFHEPLLTFIKSFFLKITDGQWGIFLTYIVSPIITLFLCFVVGYIFKKASPRLYSIVCGGR